MLSRLSAFVIWALIAATVVFWGLRLAVRPAPAPLHSVAVGDALAGRGDLSRLLGEPPVVASASPGAAPQPETASRFRLLGIMAPRRSHSGEVGHGGLALIAVDGKPARAFAVGSRLDGDLVLQSVSLRQAVIGPEKGVQTVLLEIPAFAAPATGTLPAPGSPAAGNGQAAVMAPPPPSTQAPVIQPGIPQPPIVPAAGPVQRDAGAVTQ